MNTKFFVAIVRSPDNDPKNFTLHVEHADGKPAVTISEVRERIAAAPGNALVAMSGADVVRRLQAEGSILVALSDRAFSIARDRVDWLKKGIEASQARAAEKARQAAAAPAAALAPVAPAPAPAAAPVAAPVALAKAPAAPSTPVSRNQVGVLDVAALKPRNVTLPKIGLEFFVPGSWTETATATGLRFADSERRMTAEASGFHRPNLSMAQWLDMRLTLVQHEMRYLTRDCDSYPFEGEGWRGRVKGMATEFTGTFPGDDFASRYLVACIWTDGVLASIAIRAPADVFEANRALYKWLLGRVDMNAAASTVYSPPASLADSAGANDWEDGVTPPIFGFSLEGRLGRARVMAYTFPMGLVAGVLGIIAAVLLPISKVGGGIAIAMAAAALGWFCVRLMVLRMHDVNLSGKWLLGTIALLVIATMTRNWMLAGIVSIVFWLGSLVIYCLLPGTDGDNDFGDPPGPNSTLVIVGAVLFVLMQLGQVGAVSSGKFDQQFAFPQKVAGAGNTAVAGKPFTTHDGSFTVTLPGTPVELEPPPPGIGQLDGVELHQYHLKAGGNVYVVQTVNYFDRMPDNRFDAMDGMQDAVVGKDGKLIEASPIVLKGTTGRQVKVELPGGGLRAARFTIVDSKFCMVAISAPKGKEAGPAIDAFLNSFKVN